MENSKCELGKPSEAFYYHGSLSVLVEWDGHGVMLNPQRDTGICGALGILCAEIETVLDHDGGAIISLWDLIVHTPRFCKLGRLHCNAED